METRGLTEDEIERQRLKRLLARRVATPSPGRPGESVIVQASGWPRRSRRHPQLPAA